ncbi:MAG: thiolase family protein [Chitinophagaceae bacterium]
MEPVYVIDAVRTPVGRHGGILSGIRADDLFAITIMALLERNPGLDHNAIEDVIAGDANQGGEDCRNVARMSALLAGLPVTTAGSTVNRLCGSGMQAVIDAARALACREGQLYLAGGVESMSRAPFVALRSGDKIDLVDSTIGWRFTNPELVRMNYALTMGQTADLLAKSKRISRVEQDEFALQSHEKYFRALGAGKWTEEILPVKGLSSLKDECPRHSSLQMLERLKPVFSKDGTVTAGNASGINDGASCLLLASDQAMRSFHLAPLVKVKAMAVAGVEPALMGTGPVPATLKALSRAGLKVSDIGLWEINESFAVQVIACIRELEIDPKIVNVNGGSIAIGNPLGSNGARICTTLIHEMKRTGIKYGVSTTCIGVGQGSTIIFENL